MAADAELQMLPLEAMLAEAKTITPVPAVSAAALQARAASREPTANGRPAEELTPEAQHRAEDASDGLVINGSKSNAATSKYTLDAAFGNRRPGSKALYTAAWRSMKVMRRGQAGVPRGLLRGEGFSAVHGHGQTTTT